MNDGPSTSPVRRSELALAPGTNLMATLTMPIGVHFPEASPEDQIRNTLGTILINLGERAQLLDSSKALASRSAELWGRLVGNYVGSHLSLSHLPRVDHHIFEIAGTEVEVRIQRDKSPVAFSIKYKFGDFSFDCESFVATNSSGFLEFTAGKWGQNELKITKDSPCFLHALHGFLAESGVGFKVRFYDERIPKTQSVKPIEGGKYEMASDTTPASAFDPTSKEYPAVMQGLALGISQALSPLLPKEFR